MAEELFLKADGDLTKELQKECHEMIDYVTSRQKQAKSSHQDITNVFIFMKLANIIKRLEALESGQKKEIRITDVKF